MIEADEGPSPSKKARLANQDFDFTLLQERVQKIENEEPEAMTSGREAQTDDNNTDDWMPRLNDCLPGPTWCMDRQRPQVSEEQVIRKSKVNEDPRKSS